MMFLLSVWIKLAGVLVGVLVGVAKFGWTRHSSIQSKIYEIRGERVMLDRDIAALYNVETKVLNQAVKRNIKRFPEDFMFQLSKTEFQIWKSQIVTSNSDKMGLRRPPYAFTEQGKSEMEDTLEIQNDINESTRAQLDAISTALAELQASRSQNATLNNRRPIGFIQPDDEKDS